LEIERRRGEEKPRRESPRERRRRETDLRSADKTATISGGGPPHQRGVRRGGRGGKEVREGGGRIAGSPQRKHLLPI